MLENQQQKISYQEKPVFQNCIVLSGHLLVFFLESKDLLQPSVQPCRPRFMLQISH